MFSFLCVYVCGLKSSKKKFFQKNINFLNTLTFFIREVNNVFEGNENCAQVFELNVSKIIVWNYRKMFRSQKFLGAIQNFFQVHIFLKNLLSTLDFDYQSIYYYLKKIK